MEKVCKKQPSLYGVYTLSASPRKAVYSKRSAGLPTYNISVKLVYPRLSFPKKIQCIGAKYSYGCGGSVATWLYFPSSLLNALAQGVPRVLLNCILIIVVLSSFVKYSSFSTSTIVQKFLFLRKIHILDIPLLKNLGICQLKNLHFFCERL